MKFGDIVIAVATYAVIQVLTTFLLTSMSLAVFGITMFTHYGAGLSSVFLSMLLVGYLFKVEISKGGQKVVLRVVVLAAFFEIFVIMFQPTFADWLPFASEAPSEAFSGNVVATLEWFLYDLSRRGNMVLNMLTVISLSYVGLYLGSKVNSKKGSLRKISGDITNTFGFDENNQVIWYSILPVIYFEY